MYVLYLKACSYDYFRKDPIVCSTEHTELEKIISDFLRIQKELATLLKEYENIKNEALLISGDIPEPVYIDKPAVPSRHLRPEEMEHRRQINEMNRSLRSQYSLAVSQRNHKASEAAFEILLTRHELSDVYIGLLKFKLFGIQTDITPIDIIKNPFDYFESELDIDYDFVPMI